MLFHLSNLHVLQIQGAQASHFLQGQLTSDIRNVSEKQVQPAALCNLEGRIISLMDVCQWNADFFLVLPQNLLQKVTQVFSKPAQFSRVKCIERHDIHVLGVLTDSSHSLHQPNEAYACYSTETYCAYHLSPSLSIALTTNIAKATELLKHPIDVTVENITTDLSIWDKKRLEEGILQIDTLTTEKFLPHQLKLQETPYLSFNKGCYRGQEIIARMHYRAKLKYYFARYFVSSTHKIEPGMHIYDAEKNLIGEIIDCVVSTPNMYLIAATLKNDHPNEVRFGEFDTLTSLSHPL